MKMSRAFQTLPLLGALALVACDASQATDPLADEATLTEEDQIALEVVADPDAVEAALALVDVPIATVQRRGRMGNMTGNVQDGEAYAEQARVRFQAAVQALSDQDPVQAAIRAREARQLVVRAMLAVGGPQAVNELVQRAEGLAAAVGQELGMYQNGYGLQGELAGLALRARQRLQARDSSGAGECAVLAEQRFRQRQGDPALRPGGAEVAVELATTSVTLATRLINEAGGPDDDQTRLLAVAEEYATAAADALAGGDEARAVHLADLAQWTALQGVVSADGVSLDEATAIQSLAVGLYADAEATAPTGVAADVLAWASNLIEWGSAALEENPPRGTGALWRAAVMCTWILA